MFIVSFFRKEGIYYSIISYCKSVASIYLPLVLNILHAWLTPKTIYCYSVLSYSAGLALISWKRRQRRHCQLLYYQDQAGIQLSIEMPAKCVCVRKRRYDSMKESPRHWGCKVLNSITIPNFISHIYTR